MQSVVSHFIQSNAAVVGPSDQQFEGIHDVHAADIWLDLEHFVQSKVFVLFVRRVLADLLLLLLLSFFVFLV